MAIRFRLDEFLDRHNVTAYSLGQASGVSLTTIYKITNDKVKRIDKNTLNAILVTLEEMTGEHLEVSDIVAFEREQSESAQT